MINLYIKIWKQYGIVLTLKNFFKLLVVFKGLEDMAEKFGVIEEWNSFKGHTKVGKNFTFLNLMRSKEQLETQAGVNYQKKIKYLTKV